jgi:hypothetical protein
VSRRIEPLQQGRRVGVRHEAGRVCDVLDCDTQLSIYNGTDRCSLHESLPDRPQFTRATGGAFVTYPRQSQ